MLQTKSYGTNAATKIVTKGSVVPAASRIMSNFYVTMSNVDQTMLKARAGTCIACKRKTQNPFCHGINSRSPNKMHILKQNPLTANAFLTIRVFLLSHYVII